MPDARGLPPLSLEAQLWLAARRGRARTRRGWIYRPECLYCGGPLTPHDWPLDQEPPDTCGPNCARCLVSYLEAKGRYDRYQP